jgi:DNA repair exonuclease SbcCD ATPase subunit
MSAEGELHNAYSEWRRLSEAEGSAIRAGNWRFVAECQEALSRLRPTIDRLTEQARQEAKLPGPGTSGRKMTSRASVLELIELQRRNLWSLEQRRQKLSAHIEQLSRTSHNLRGIQRSYASPIASGWTSYS